MRCTAVHPLLVGYRDGELSPGEAVRVREHLDGCRPCAELDDALMAATPEPFLPTPTVGAEDELRLSRALDDVRVAPPEMHHPLFDIDASRVWTHVAWAAALLLCIGWGWSNYQHAAMLQAQLDAAPAQNETVLDEAGFRPASWAPSESGSEPGE
ncbi:MAG: zf-HC2 domain-containing protein [Proteobacteria bacterium]|nr:zf-HC2 domain-containing protein [Pseudomonadota bacterium]